MSLFARVLLANALILGIATLLLLFSPIEISFPVTNTQAVILVAGFIVSVILNMLLLRGVIAPLRRLTDTMRAIEPLQPGRRLTIRHADADVAALTDAFNDMLDRLETERRESARRELLAQEAERQRIARELHDEVGQVLTGVVVALEHHAPPSVWFSTPTPPPAAPTRTVRRRSSPPARRSAAASTTSGASRASCVPRSSTTSACRARCARCVPRRRRTTPCTSSADSTYATP
jgi:HAMP domain-containing protein